MSACADDSMVVTEKARRRLLNCCVVTKPRRAIVIALAGSLIGALAAPVVAPATPPAGWSTHAGNPQHTAVSPTAGQPFETIRWSTPVDLAPPSGEILIHYGSPLLTPTNTIIVPVKTGSTGRFRVEARNGTDGSLIWSQSTDYVLPPHNWTPSYAPALTSSNRVYFAGAGGTVYFRDSVDASAGAGGQFAFYGISNYTANPASFNSTVFINTPITPDSAGNIYFGFRTVGTAPLGLTSGIARIDTNGNGTWVSAVAASGGDATITRVPHQAAPALSNDVQTLYAVVASGTPTGTSYLVGLDPATLALKESSPGVNMRVALKDPRNGGVNNAFILDDSSASPMVGPDGDVYYGILGNPFNGSRGWMLHFSGNLTQSKTPGGFGWDNTPSIVPASIVPSYTGASSYLIFTKYNNYAGQDGGDGVNKIAILDPNATMVEPHPSSNGQLVMKQILAIAGPTPDPEYVAQFPKAVREWCINTAAVDPSTGSVMVNSEDGKLYRWDLATNSFSQTITLSSGIGEAYTPTVIGPDGTVYAINYAVLNAIGQGSQPDLVETAVSDPPAAILPGATFTVTDTVQNQGGSTAGSTTTRYYLSLDLTKSPDDTLLTGTRTIGGLTPNDSSTGNATVTIPAATPLGTYFLLACADDLNAVTESSEANNCLAAAHPVQVARPDLIETAISNPPANAAPGTSFPVTDTTQNQGGIGAGNSTTRYYLSTNGTKDATDKLLTGSRGVPSLGPGATSSPVGSINVTIPSNTTLGTYFLLACADDTAVVTESIETNNCLASTATVNITRPDLIETAVSNPPGLAKPGDIFSVTDTTQNQGAVSAPASTTRYYFSVDGAKGTGDKLLTGSRAVTTLNAGASLGGTVNVTIPTATALGTYFLLACADDTQNVIETNDANNCKASATKVQVTNPDLIETAVSDPPAAAAPGGAFPVTDTVKNQGPVSAGASTTRYYLSLDGLKGSGDKLLTGTRSVGTLVAGGTSPAPSPVTVTIPTSITLTSYFLLACADDTAKVPETNETNNCKASANKVNVTRPDLLETVVSDPPASATAGSSFSVNDTVQNSGAVSAAASTTRYYLSLDTTKGSDRLLTGTRSVPSLGAGVSSPGAPVTVTIPTSTPTGSYFLLACADDLAVVTETNETNNCKASTNKVTVSP